MAEDANRVFEALQDEGTIRLLQDAAEALQDMEVWSWCNDLVTNTPAGEGAIWIRKGFKTGGAGRTHLLSLDKLFPGVYNVEAHDYQIDMQSAVMEPVILPEVEDGSGVVGTAEKPGEAVEVDHPDGTRIRVAISECTNEGGRVSVISHRYAFISVYGGDGRPLTAAEAFVWAALAYLDDADMCSRLAEAFGMDPSEAGPLESQTKVEPTRRKNAKPTFITVVPNEAINHAVFGRYGRTFVPSDYFTQRAVEIDTGGGGHAIVSLAAPEGTEITAPESDYFLNDRTSYWLDALYSLVDAGNTEITGAMLLMANGFKNPYDESAAEAMRDAANAMFKATGTRIAINTTKERRKRKPNSKIIESFEFVPVVDARLTIERRESEGGEVRDFVIELRDTPEKALPLLAVAESREMRLTISTEDAEFKGTRVVLDDRQMWRYVQREMYSKSKVKQHGGVAIIKLDTMWRALDLPDPVVGKTSEDGQPLTEAQIEAKVRKAVSTKRGRMLRKLELMLNQSTPDAESDKTGRNKYGRIPTVDRWEWTHAGKKASGKVDGVKIWPSRKPKQS